MLRWPKVYVAMAQSLCCGGPTLIRVVFMLQLPNILNCPMESIILVKMIGHRNIKFNLILISLKCLLISQ